MKHCPTVVLLWIGLSGLAGPCAAQTRCAPLYSLPPDKTWVEYSWKATEPDRKERVGTLRISSVGQKEVEGVLHRWIEIKGEVTPSKAEKQRFRKLLVAEAGFAKSQSLLENVAEGYAWDAPDGPVVRLTTHRLESFIDLGFEGKDANLVKAGEEEEVETGLGKFRCNHLKARAKSGQRVVEYHGWLTADVPFGWAKFEVRETVGRDLPRAIFTAEAAKSGEGAQSVLDESRAK